jgi:hypothetical protein
MDDRITARNQTGYAIAVVDKHATSRSMTKLGVHLTDADRRVGRSTDYYSVGAPFRCLDGRQTFNVVYGSSGYYIHQHDLLLIDHQFPHWRIKIPIPYRPLPGLVYSWAFWAAVAYIGLTGVSFARVHRRLRKGKCPGCAYVLAGLARCPECGTVVRGDGLEARPTGE